VKPSLLLSLSLLLALPAAAAFCDLDLRLEEGQLRWRAVSGAVNYTILETYGALRPSVYSSTRQTFINVRRASAPARVRYIVTAEIEEGTRIMATGTDACTSTLEVMLPVDPAFRALTRKAVLPVVGSTAGAFGGRFKTSLELRGDGSQKGRIVFHPAGQVASSSDPSIPYAFTTPERILKFEDVVAALGQSGIGSIDIIPDEDAPDRIPEAVARIYSETSFGTFGSFTRAVLPYDFLRPQGFEVRVPDDPRFRLNLGVRTLEATSLQVLFYDPTGRLDGFKTISFPAGWVEMRAASDFVGRALVPGETLVMNFTGASVPFYTLTENATNDPTLIIAGGQATAPNGTTFVD
jgi:hypothetical protein